MFTSVIFKTLLIFITLVNAQFLEELNRILPCADITEQEVRDQSSNGYIVIQDDKILANDSHADTWRQLMENGTIQALAEKYYGQRMILFVSDINEFMENGSNTTVTVLPLDPDRSRSMAHDY